MTEITDSCYFFHQGSNSHAVLCLHGLNGSDKELGSLPMQLAKDGFTVIIPKIPGYSAGYETSNFETWLSQIRELASLLEEQGNQVSLAGFSMGATLATALAIQKKSIQSVCLLSPVLGFDGWSIPWYYHLLVVAYFFGIRSWIYHESEPYGLKNLTLRKRVKETINTSEGGLAGANSFSAQALYESQRLIRFVKRNVEKFSNDLMIIHSVDDESVSPKSPEFIIKNCKSEVRRVIWLGDSYHVITLDNEKEIVLNEVSYFFKENFHSNSIKNDLSANRFIKAVKDRTVG